jgi:hypothetical protein
MQSCSLFHLFQEQLRFEPVGGNLHAPHKHLRLCTRVRHCLHQPSHAALRAARSHLLPAGRQSRRARRGTRPARSPRSAWLSWLRGTVSSSAHTPSRPVFGQDLRLKKTRAAVASCVCRWRTASSRRFMNVSIPGTGAAGAATGDGCQPSRALSARQWMPTAQRTGLATIDGRNVHSRSRSSRSRFSCASRSCCSRSARRCSLMENRSCKSRVGAPGLPAPLRATATR